MAEAITYSKIRSRGLLDWVDVDSCGTGAWHAGETADPRTLAVLDHHGIPHPSRSRQVKHSDFVDKDLVIAMDRVNIRDLSGLPFYRPDKVSLMLQWTGANADVQDPYYGGPDGFERMYAILTEACEALLDKLELAGLGR
jgi:protein-tyrosine phosphatase